MRPGKHITFEQLQEHFDKPLVDAAHILGVCTTFFKVRARGPPVGLSHFGLQKTCRKHGIKRWPWRKVAARVFVPG